MPLLMFIYSFGFFAVFSIFFLFYLHAYRKKEDLGLNSIEIFYTRFHLEAYLIYLSVAAVSLLIVILGGAGFSFWSGIIYFLVGPLRAIHGILSRKRFKKPDSLVSGTGSAPA